MGRSSPRQAGLPPGRHWPGGQVARSWEQLGMVIEKSPGPELGDTGSEVWESKSWNPGEEPKGQVPHMSLKDVMGTEPGPLANRAPGVFPRRSWQSSQAGPDPTHWASALAPLPAAQPHSSFLPQDTPHSSSSYSLRPHSSLCQKPTMTAVFSRH